MPYHVIDVNRKEYLASITEIEDEKSRGFANMALGWWDRHYSWSAEGSVILTDALGRHLCYLFYKIDRYGDYLTIHNILTPQCHRRHGYALILLQWVFALAASRKVRRFKAICVPKALAFYESLGLCFWGLTATKDYYCNLPIPVDGLDGVQNMVEQGSTEHLAGKELQMIYDKVIGNDRDLDVQEQHVHDEGMCVLQGAYRQNELIACMDEANGVQSGC